MILMSLTVALVGCDPVSTESRYGEGGPFTVQTAKGPVSYKSTNDFVSRQVLQITASAASMRAFLNNTTSQEFGGGHGTQIEFLGANGVTYLWYPGNTRPLPGRWQVQDGPRYPSICFQYGSNTYNPVTGQGGGGWECSPGPAYLFQKMEVTGGDVFRLASGKLPFILPGRAYITLEAAAAQAGTPRTFPNKVNWPAQIAAARANAAP